MFMCVCVCLKSKHVTIKITCVRIVGLSRLYEHLRVGYDILYNEM